MRRWWAGTWLVCGGCMRPNPLFDVDRTGGDSEGVVLTGAVTTTLTGSSTTGIDGSTGSSGSSMTGPEPSSSTGGAAGCGDGVLDPGEACDGGPAPQLEPGACRPDCAGEIVSRTIFVTPEPLTGQFAMGADITKADDICMDAAAQFGVVGVFKAMISDEVRYASKAPHDGDCSADWPLQRFTAYHNLQEQLVWVTGAVRLLGVVPGLMPDQPNTQKPLLGAIAPESLGVWTGLASTWQTASTCMEWYGGPQIVGTVGDAGAVEGFLDGGGEQLCAADYYLVCVEQ